MNLTITALNFNHRFTNNFIDLAFSSRICKLNFTKVNTQNYTVQMPMDENIYNLDKTNFYFVEPTLTFRLGYKWAKFHAQAIYSNKITNEPLNYQKFSFNIGLHFTIASRYKNTPKISRQLDNVLETN